MSGWLLPNGCLVGNLSAHSGGQDQRPFKGCAENSVSFKPQLACWSTLTPGSTRGTRRVEDAPAPPEWMELVYPNHPPTSDTGTGRGEVQHTAHFPGGDGSHRSRGLKPGRWSGPDEG